MIPQLFCKQLQSEFYSHVIYNVMAKLKKMRRIDQNRLLMRNSTANAIVTSLLCKSTKQVIFVAQILLFTLPKNDLILQENKPKAIAYVLIVKVFLWTPTVTRRLSQKVSIT